MNTVVWIMVMFSYGNKINIGPEFNTKEKCERAVYAVEQSANERVLVIRASAPWCVRIEK